MPLVLGRTLVAGLMAAPCLLMASAALGGAPDAGYHDPYPLPADTVIVSMAEVGVHGGQFVVAQTGSPRTFNPMMANEASSLAVTGLMYTALVSFNRETWAPAPELAKSWDTSADGRTLTFHLRRGARFSDGHPITSDDVLFTFEVCFDQALHPPQQDVLLVDGRKPEISAPDPYTVVIRLPVRHPLFLNGLGSLSIMPRHVLEAPFRQGRFASAYNTTTKPESLVTSGSFRLHQFVPNEKTVLEPNPYWYAVDARGQRIPYLAQLVFLNVPDLNAASLQFQSGTLDAIDIVSAQDYLWYSQNQQKGNFTFYDVGPLLGAQYLVFNLNRVREPKPGRHVGDPYVGAVKYAWFSDPTFRRAVSHAIDRDALIRGPLMGEGVKSWSLTTVADKVWSTPGLTGADYDPAESRRLLASLGFRDRDGDGILEDARGNPLSFTLKTNTEQTVRTQMCVLIQDDLAKVGIRCLTGTVEFNTLVGNLRNDFQYDVALFGFSGGVPPDPGTSQNILKSSGATHIWNASQPHPETTAEAAIDSLIAANISTDDMAIRKRTWSQIQTILNQECFLVWLPRPRYKVPIRNRFGNLEPSVIPPRVLSNIACVFVRPPVTAGASR